MWIRTSLDPTRILMGAYSTPMVGVKEPLGLFRFRTKFIMEVLPTLQLPSRITGYAFYTFEEVVAFWCHSNWLYSHNLKKDENIDINWIRQANQEWLSSKSINGWAIRKNSIRSNESEESFGLVLNERETLFLRIFEIVTKHVKYSLWVTLKRWFNLQWFQ